MGVSMTARELYDTDPECQAFIAQWVADKRCPVGFADYLNEHGLGGPANAAWWAQNEPDRSWLTPSIKCGPMPANHANKWKWRGTFAGFISRAYEYPGSFDLEADDPASAIIELLDSCRDEVFDPAKNVGKGLRTTGSIKT